MRSVRIALFVLFSLFWMAEAHAQVDLGRVDVSNVRVDELSDDQIREILVRAEEQDLTSAELERMALARGMRPSEVVKLRERIARLRAADRQREAAGGRAPAGGAVEDEEDVEDPFDVLTTSRRRYRSERDSTDLFGFDSLKTETRVFGEELFASDALTFEPSLNIPTPQNYTLAPGDELIVDVWGAAQMTYQVPVTRDGTVRIENLGPISVNGLRLEDAKQRIISRLSQLYAGLGNHEPSGTSVFADVTLGRARTIKAHIIGEVLHPGSYTLPSVATPFNALYVCGGPTENGTYRQIQVLRGGRVVHELDVYDFLIYGRWDDSFYLQDQDIIKVDPYLSRIAITGEVKRPAFFELRPDETLVDLIRFAGFFTGEAYTRSIKIYRNTATEKRILTVAEDRFEGFSVTDGDEVFVDPLLKRFENRVEIRGAVYRKGDFELGDVKTVYGLIRRAEGLRGDAFMPRAHIYRTRDDLTTELVSFNLGDLVRAPEQYDLPLLKNDVVVIPSVFELKEEYSVGIEGSVQEPDEYPFMENMTLNDLIVMAGGFKEEASPLRVEVSRRRAERDTTRTLEQIARIFYFDVSKQLSLEAEGSRFILEPFDKVFVRKAPGYIAQRDVQITGEVLYPGTYTIAAKDDRISDIINRAGGLTPDAYPRGARLIRTLNDIGPVGINLDQIVRQPHSSYDLLVEVGDSIHVPLRLETVKVAGAVYAPANVRFERSLDLADYISRAGGVTDQGDLRRTYVVYANGSVDRIKKTLFITRYPRMEPGAQIVVPVKPEREGMSVQERTLIWSSIVSVAAVLSTTIFQILNARSGS